MIQDLQISLQQTTWSVQKLYQWLSIIRLTHGPVRDVLIISKLQLHDHVLGICSQANATVYLAGKYV